MSFPPLKDFGFSQSLVKMALQCDRQLMFNLNRWDKPGKEENFLFGNLCHELMDMVYSDFAEPPDEEQLEELYDSYIDRLDEAEELNWCKDKKREYYKAITLTVMGRYFEYYKDDFKFKFEEVEGQFDVKWNGFRLIGKRDGLFRKGGRRLLFEHKTKSTIYEATIMQMLEFDFQNLYYIISNELDTGSPVDGVLYNVIRKPQSKQGKNETLKEFAERLGQVIDKDPEHYFKRYEVEYSKEQKEEFQFELFEKLTRIKDLIEGKRPPLKNEGFCFAGYPCDYLKACSQGHMEGFTQRKHISPELA